MEISYKRLGKERIQEALMLVWEVFQIFEVPDFSDEGVREYKRIIDETVVNKSVFVYGALDENKIVGVLCMRENAHIGYFYVHPSYHRRGIGRALFNLMREDYPERAITVNACPYGVPVYERLGFVKTDTQKCVNGVIFTPMKKD